jgi:CheY-like chemotaxis protein
MPSVLLSLSNCPWQPLHDRQTPQALIIFTEHPDMSFALYRRPGAVVFLDDDPDYLEMVGEVMPPDWLVRLLMRPVACIDMLLAEPPAREADIWRQQEIVNRWRGGVALIPQILHYWREDGTTRFARTQVCVVDYAMPSMSGLRVLSELTPWSGSRILLTGRADEQLAVSAFNRGLIEQFIPKQSPNIRLRLTGAIQSLLQKPDPRYEQVWRITLSREQSALLDSPLISAALEKLALAQGWVEHVVLGAPFGILALDRKGHAVWLQLEPSDRLPELAEMAASQDWDAQSVQEVAEGKKIVDLELQLALGTNTPRLQPATAVECETSTLYMALFQIDERWAPAAASSYERFIAIHGQRTLQD